MAAPSEISIQDLNGSWVMDKGLSGDTDSIFKLQGMSWITRTAIGVATITLHVKQYKEADDVTRIDISQTLTGGISGTSEKRTLNWGVNDHTDHIFGHVNGQTRFFKAAEVAGKTRPDLEMQTKIGKDSDDQLALRFLRGEILGDGSECEGFVVEGENGDSFIQSWVKSVDNGWTAEQIWGFENVDGKRHYTRRVVVAKNGTYKMVRLVYNFQGRED